MEIIALIWCITCLLFKKGKFQKRQMKSCVFLCPWLYMYVLEAWTLSKTMKSKIEVFKMWCLCRIGRISCKDRLTNDRVLDKLTAEINLQIDTQKWKFSYYGQIKSGNNILTTAVEGKIQRRRPRGRLRNNWFRDIKELTQMTADGHLWSAIANRPSKRRCHSKVIQVSSVHLGSPK